MVKRPKPSAYLQSTPIVGGKPRKSVAKAVAPAVAPTPVESVPQALPPIAEPIETAPAAVRERGAVFAAAPAPEPVLAQMPDVQGARAEPVIPSSIPARGPTLPIFKPGAARDAGAKLPRLSGVTPRLGAGLGDRASYAVAAVFVAAIIAGGVITWRIEQARAPAAATAPVQSLTSIDVVMQQIAPDKGADLTWEELFDRYQIEQTLRTRTLELNAVGGRQPQLKDKVGLPRVKLVLSGNG